MDVLSCPGGSQLLRVLEGVGHWFSESEAKWWKLGEEAESNGRSVRDRVVVGLVEGMVVICML